MVGSHLDECVALLSGREFASPKPAPDPKFRNRHDRGDETVEAPGILSRLNILVTFRAEPCEQVWAQFPKTRTEPLLVVVRKLRLTGARCPSNG